MIHRVLLSPVDQLMLSRTARIMLVFSIDNPDAALNPLNESLRRTCAQIPYLKGSVYQSHRSGCLGVTWSDDDEGPQLEEVKPPDGMPSYLELKAQGVPHDYLSKCVFPAYVSDTTAEAPAFRVSYTKFKGGLLLVFHVHHNVMDATGLAVVINAWAKNTRCPVERSATLPDILDDLAQRTKRLRAALSPEYIADPNVAIETRPTAAPTFSDTAPEAESKHVPTGPALPPCLSRIFTFRGDKLDKLSKTLATISPDKPPSKNTIISAFFWSRVSLVRYRRIEKERQKNPSAVAEFTSSNLVTATNLRDHVFGTTTTTSEQPFLGNLVTVVRAKCDVSDLISSDLNTSSTFPSPLLFPSPLPHLTSRITSSYALATRQTAIDILRLVDTTPDTNHFRLQLSRSYNGRDFVSSSWAHFPFYADFGSATLGKPSHVRLPAVASNSEGMIVFMPRRKGEGEEERGGEDIEIVIALREDDMRELVRDEVLMGYVRKYHV